MRIEQIRYGLAMFAFCVLPMSAQTATSGSSEPPKTAHFDIVTIRPVSPDSHEIPEYGVDGGTFQLKNSPLTYAVIRAFFDMGKVPAGFSDSLPKWVREEKFDLTAKMSVADYETLQRETHDSAPSIPMPMLHQMLLNMLEERCNLAVHHTSTTIHAYSLELGKRGINAKRLKVSSGLDGIPADAVGNAEWRLKNTPAADGEGSTSSFYNMTMQEFVKHLSNSAMVQDNTRLTARYNFSVELDTVSGPERYDVSPLGLQWKAFDIVTDNVVIDHIDRPTPN